MKKSINWKRLKLNATLPKITTNRIVEKSSNSFKRINLSKLGVRFSHSKRETVNDKSILPDYPKRNDSLYTDINLQASRQHTLNGNFNQQKTLIGKIKEKREQKRLQMLQAQKRAGYIFLAFVSVGLLFSLASSMHKNNVISREEASLNALVDSIMFDLSENNYDAALEKASQLHFTASGGSTKREWDKTRTALIKEIEDKKQEYEYQMSLPVYSEEIVLSEKEITVSCGEEFSITCSVLPANAVNIDSLRCLIIGKCIEQTGDYSFVCIDDGQAEILFRTDNNISAKCVINCLPVTLDKIEFSDPDTFSLGLNNTVDLKVNLYPENTSMTHLVFSSDDDILDLEDGPDPLTVTVFGKSEGIAKLYVESENGLKAEKTIEVKYKEVEELKIIEPSNLSVGDSGRFEIAFTPFDCSDRSVKFSSSTPKTLLVDESGNYQILSDGPAKVKVFHNKTSQTADLVFDIPPIEPTEIKLVPTEDIDVFLPGDTLQLTAKFAPDNTTDKKIIWSSSNTSVASVSSKGLVKFKGVGETVITASSPNGVAGEFTAKVDAPPQKYRVSMSAKITENGGIGSRWVKELYVDGNEVRNGSTVSYYVGDSCNIGVAIYENDSDPDYDSESITYEITEECLKSGFTHEFILYPTENHGRKSGHYTEWTVIVTVKPCK